MDAAGRSGVLASGRITGPSTMCGIECVPSSVPVPQPVDASAAGACVEPVLVADAAETVEGRERPSSPWWLEVPDIAILAASPFHL